MNILAIVITILITLGILIYVYYRSYTPRSIVGFLMALPVILVWIVSLPIFQKVVIYIVGFFTLLSIMTYIFIPNSNEQKASPSGVGAIVTIMLFGFMVIFAIILSLLSVLYTLRMILLYTSGESVNKLNSAFSSSKKISSNNAQK
jgi:hypothetical protein